MTDNRSKSEKKIDDFFSKVADEAQELPVRTIDIPSENNDVAGLCLIAEERHPASIDEVTAAISHGIKSTSEVKAPQQEPKSSLQESLPIEIERARFTSTPLSLALIQIDIHNSDKSPNTDLLSIAEDSLHRVDIVARLNNHTLAILMPETGGTAAEERCSLVMNSLRDTAAGCGIFSCHGKGCPESEEFISSALLELEKSSSQNGKIFRNSYTEPSSSQVTAEEKSELFNLFGEK